jgi:hypothetical protein
VSAWRRKAIELLPAQRPIIERADSPMALWVELFAHFVRVAPAVGDDNLRPILMYAFWCLSPAAGALPSDASTAVWCAFFENLALHKELWGRFRQWFTHSQFEQIRPSFCYFLSSDEQKELSETYYGKGDVSRKRRRHPAS